MKQKLFYWTFICLLLFSSCRSKKQLTVVEMPRLVLMHDSVRMADTVDVPASVQSLLTFDHSTLHELKRRPSQPTHSYHPSELPPAVSDRYAVKRGTHITTRTIDVSHVCSSVKRVRIYDVTHRDVPESFEGFRMLFAADLHYRSLLNERGLHDLTRLLMAQRADVLLLGGDYHEGCQYVAPVIAEMGKVKTTYGTYAVLGNNDYEACYDEVVAQMKRQQIHVLEHRVDTICRGNDRLLIAGVRNPFDLATNGVSPTLGLSADDFVVLLTHTPDYAEDVSIANSDLVLAGHTHGGQVTLFGLYAPVVPSRYGQRFLSGLKYNSHHIPMIITNGIGTSKKAVRMFAPAEVVLVVLHRLKDD